MLCLCARVGLAHLVWRCVVAEDPKLAFDGFAIDKVDGVVGGRHNRQDELQGVLSRGSGQPRMSWSSSFR